jgi:predicted PurR-regulated permease PerM
MTAIRGQPAGPPPDRVEVVFSLPTVVKALAVFFGVIVIYLAQDALLSIALSLVFVFGLDPPVSALVRRGWGRGRAAMLVIAAIVLVVFVIVVWAARPLWNVIEGFVGDLPGYVEEARKSGVLADLDENTDALAKLQDALLQAAKDLPESAMALLGAAAGAIGNLFSLVTLLFLTLFGLINKPQLADAGMALMRSRHAAKFDRVQREVCDAISYSLLGNVVISIIAGSVVGIAAVIVGAPSPAVLGLIVGLFDLIPQVGSSIAAFIVVSVTLIAEGVLPAAILGVTILVYQQLENYLIQPAVMRQAVELSGFATIAVVIVGSALLGVVGAILAVPVAASVKIVVRELTEGRRLRIAALESATPVSPGTDDARPPDRKEDSLSRSGA